MDTDVAEFDVLAEWTAQVALRLGTDFYEPAACRGSGDPAWLEWLAERLHPAPGEPFLDVGAGLGGPSAWLARHTGSRILLTDVQPRACRASKQLFGLPYVRALATLLPVATASMAAAWSLGVLCTVGGHENQRAMLRELRRTLRPQARLGLLVLVAGQLPVIDPPEGNTFPAERELSDLLAAADLRQIDAVNTGELPSPPPEWTRHTDAVEAELRRWHGSTREWRWAERQSNRIGELTASGVLMTRLLVAAPIG